jgi:hypothetical protein
MKVMERTRCPVSAPLAGNSGLSAYVPVGVEDFREPLQAQIVIPRPCEADVLLVQLNQMHVMIAHDIAAPLLGGNVIVTPVLCEALDYVEWSERCSRSAGNLCSDCT